MYRPVFQLFNVEEDGRSPKYSIHNVTHPLESAHDKIRWKHKGFSRSLFLFHKQLQGRVMWVDSVYKFCTNLRFSEFKNLYLTPAKSLAGGGAPFIHTQNFEIKIWEAK